MSNVDRRRFLAGSASAVAAAGLAAGCDAVDPAPTRAGPPATVAGLSVWHFARVVGDEFSLHPGEGAAPMSVRLVAVMHRGAPYAPSWREPFSAFFRIDSERPLPQGLYTIEHPETGRHTLFLVPSGPSGHELEAVFT
jgi:hypothetical protein